MEPMNETLTPAQTDLLDNIKMGIIIAIEEGESLNIQALCRKYPEMAHEIAGFACDAIRCEVGDVVTDTFLDGADRETLEILIGQNYQQG